jgi:6-pyruvoyl-tetrahydropterin synthase
MTYTISKEFAFSAAHHLNGLPPSHPCSRVHGHNYVVRVVLRRETRSGLRRPGPDEGVHRRHP